MANGNGHRNQLLNAIQEQLDVQRPQIRNEANGLFASEYSDLEERRVKQYLFIDDNPNLSEEQKIEARQAVDHNINLEQDRIIGQIEVEIANREQEFEENLINEYGLDQDQL